MPVVVQLPFASVVPKFGVQLGVPGGVCVAQYVKTVFGMLVVRSSVQASPTVKLPLAALLIVSVAVGVMVELQSLTVKENGADTAVISLPSKVEAVFVHAPISETLHGLEAAPFQKAPEFKSCP